MFLLLILALGLCVLSALIACDVLDDSTDDLVILGDDDSVDPECATCNKQCVATSDCSAFNIDPANCPTINDDSFLSRMCDMDYGENANLTGYYMRACTKSDDCHCLTAQEYMQLTGCSAW
jgi:hypothetical protein